MRPALWGAAALGLGFVAGAWGMQRHDRAVLAELDRVQDSTLQAITVANARARDSLTRLRMADQARADSAQRTADRLARQAARHAAADRAGDSVLATVTTPTDSLPIVVGQRDNARAAYAGLLASNVEHQRADSLHLQADTAHYAADALDTAEAGARERSLRAVNAKLRLDLEARRGGLNLGILRVPGWLTEGAKLGAVFYAGCKFGGGC